MKVTKAELIAAIEKMPDNMDVEFEWERPPVRDFEAEAASGNHYICWKPGPVTYAKLVMTTRHDAPASTDIEV